MAPFSGGQLRTAWRHAVETDWHALSYPEKPLETITLSRGTEDRFVPWVREPFDLHHAFSSDGDWLAISIEQEIDLYNTITGQRSTLLGHTATVTKFAFAPGVSTTLVSQGTTYNRRIPRNEIIVWDLDQLEATYPEDGANRVFDCTDSIVNRERSKNLQKVHSLSEELDRTDRSAEAPEHCFTRPSDRRIPRPMVIRMLGMLCPVERTQVFSNAGTTIIFMPHDRPEPLFRGDEWDIHLYNIETDNIVILQGHRAVIMWSSFSPDDQLVASASQDETFRIWNASSGELIHTWAVTGRNLRGVFCSDGQRFLGSDGQGTLRIWSVATGDVLWYNEAKLDSRKRLAIDRSLDGRYVVAGGDTNGEIVMFDLQTPTVEGEQQDPTQYRKLSLVKTDLSDQKKLMASGMLGVRFVSFIF